MADQCLLTTLPFASPAGWTGAVYQTIAEALAGESTLLFWGEGSEMSATSGAINSFTSRLGEAATYSQTSTARPTLTANGDPDVLRGLPFMELDGSLQFMNPDASLPSLPAVGAYSIIDVFRCDDPIRLQYLWGTQAATDDSRGVYCSGGSSVSFTHGNNGARISAPIAAGVWTAMACGWNGTRHTVISGGLRVNGTPTSTPALAMPVTLCTRAVTVQNTTRLNGGLAMRMIFAGKDVTADAALWKLIRDYVHARFGLSSNPLVA